MREYSIAGKYSKRFSQAFRLTRRILTNPVVNPHQESFITWASEEK